MPWSSCYGCPESARSPSLDAFDFVITVALGSTLATVVLSSSVALAEVLTALALLVALQYVVAWASVRNRRVEHLVKSEPTLLYRSGFLDEAMRRERVTPDEVTQAARGQGHVDLGSVGAVVLETDGTPEHPGGGARTGAAAMTRVWRRLKDQFWACRCSAPSWPPAWGWG